MTPPVILTDFSVGLTTYRIARLGSALTLYEKAVDAFDNVAWNRCDANVRSIFDLMVFEDRTWSVRWNTLEQRVGTIGNAVVLGTSPEGSDDPVLLDTYVESHGNHGRGADTYEARVYRPRWATLAEPGAKSARVWTMEAGPPDARTLLRALLFLTKAA